MSIASILGIALVTALAGRLLRQYNPTVGLAVSFVGGVILLLGCIGEIQRVAESMEELLAKAQVEISFFGLLLKALGICYLCQFAGDLCQDAGETAMAGYVELAGKIVMVGLSLPMVHRVVETVIKLIEL